MRALVLTADSAEATMASRPTPTTVASATLRRGRVPFTCVHPTQLLGELLTGDPVGLVVVDVDSVRWWTPGLFEAIRRRYSCFCPPEVIVIGGVGAGWDATAAFVQGVSNWLPVERAGLLMKYWNWGRVRWAAEPRRRKRVVEILETLQRLSCGKRGHLFASDGELHVRIAFADGMVGLPEVVEFETEFLRRVMGEVNGWTMYSATHAVRFGSSLEWRNHLVQNGHWSKAVLRDALEQQLRSVIRWLGGAQVNTAEWCETELSWVPELTWSVEELVAESSIQTTQARWSIAHQTAVVANDNMLAHAE